MFFELNCASICDPSTWSEYGTDLNSEVAFIFLVSDLTNVTSYSEIKECEMFSLCMIFLGVKIYNLLNELLEQVLAFSWILDIMVRDVLARMSPRYLPVFIPSFIFSCILLARYLSTIHVELCM